MTGLAFIASPQLVATKSFQGISLQDQNAATSIDCGEFWRKSLLFFEQAPVLATARAHPGIVWQAPGGQFCYRRGDWESLTRR